jgi:hypothetical protein
MTDIIARTQPSLKEVFLTLEGAARRMRLRKDQEKTKYMITSQNAKTSKNITIGNYTFGVVQRFTYLGSSANCSNDNSWEIKIRILITDKYYGLKNHLKSQNHRKVKPYYRRH